MADFTFSTAPRAHACPRSFALPQRQHEDDGSRAGTAQHIYVATLGTTGYRDAALDAVAPEHREACGDLVTDGAPIGQPYRHEVALSYDVATKRGAELTLPGPRACPPVPPTTVCGTCDVVLVSDEALEVHDWKSKWDAHPEPAASNRQLLVGLLALRAAHGPRQTYRVGIWRLSDGPPRSDVAAVDDFALDLLADELRDDVQRVLDAPRARPAVVEGAWCRYCPAWQDCPEKARRYALARTTVDGANALEASIMRAIREDPARARREYSEMKQLIERVGSYVKAHAVELGGWAQSDGTRYGPRTVKRAELDGDKVGPVIERLWGSAAAWASVKCEATKKSLREAARLAKAAGLVQTIVEGERVAEAALREAGAWVMVPREIVEEYDDDAAPPPETLQN